MFKAAKSRRLKSMGPNNLSVVFNDYVGENKTNGLVSENNQEPA